MKNQTWKEKIAADTEYASQFSQFNVLSQDVENCPHELIIKRYEMIACSERMCDQCGLINPPVKPNQKILWSCDCGHTNHAKDTKCSECATRRGRRMSKELQEEAEHRDQWISARVNELTFVNPAFRRQEAEADYQQIFHAE